MKANQIMRRNSGNRIMPLLAITTLFIAGCAGDRVRIEFPLDHPANPQAIEAEFVSPQNPFQTDFTAMGTKTTSDSIMDPKARPMGRTQPMDHDMGPRKENQSESQSEKNPTHMDSSKQHQEHSQ